MDYLVKMYRLKNNTKLTNLIRDSEFRLPSIVLMIGYKINISKSIWTVSIINRNLITILNHLFKVIMYVEMKLLLIVF